MIKYAISAAILAYLWYKLIYVPALVITSNAAGVVSFSFDGGNYSYNYLPGGQTKEFGTGNFKVIASSSLVPEDGVGATLVTATSTGGLRGNVIKVKSVLI